MVRRRIREKTKPEDLGEEYSRLEALKELIMEEKKATARDEGEILGITAVKLRELQRCTERKKSRCCKRG